MNGVACYDCKNRIDMGDPSKVWCGASQLKDYLDHMPVAGGFSSQNTVTPAETVRDVKSMCGHRAEWFIPKV